MRKFEGSRDSHLNLIRESEVRGGSGTGEVRERFGDAEPEPSLSVPARDARVTTVQQVVGYTASGDTQGLWRHLACWVPRAPVETVAHPARANSTARERHAGVVRWKQSYLLQRHAQDGCRAGRRRGCGAPAARRHGSSRWRRVRRTPRQRPCPGTPEPESVGLRGAAGPATAAVAQ